MKCFMCKGETEKKLVNYLVDVDNTIIIIKEVPANVCKQCGERYFDNDVMKNLEKIIDDVKKVSVEISIVKYNEKTA
ncbi:MAG: type II toxin-antitoxin system MqsA family antitoxin [Clostridia bacterium]|nr:type II toxin-antitoxin system MqsA family antitoxin [Clostridia bacterium]